MERPSQRSRIGARGPRGIAMCVADGLGRVATALAGLSAHVYTPRSKLSKEGRRRCWVEMCEAAKRQPFPPAPAVVTFCAAVLRAEEYRLARLYLAVVMCCVHRYTLSRALFQRSCSQARFQAHSDALRTLQHFFYGARSDCKVIPSSHQTVNPYLKAAHLRNNSRYLSGSTTLHQTTTGSEPNVSTNAYVSVSTANSQMDTSGARFIPTVYLTHVDDDTNSHMSDTPLQLPASAWSPSHKLGSDPRAKCSQSPTETKLDWIETLAITVSRCLSSKCTCSSWTPRSGSNELEVLYSINKAILLLPLINMKLRNKPLSILWQQIRPPLRWRVGATPRFLVQD